MRRTVQWRSGFGRLVTVLSIVWVGLYVLSAEPHGDVATSLRVDRALRNIEAMLSRPGDSIEMPNGDMVDRAEAEVARTRASSIRERLAGEIKGHALALSLPPLWVFLLYLTTAWVAAGFAGRGRP